MSQEDQLNGPRVPEAINLQQEWRLGDQLGTGGFANVYRTKSGNGTPAVVKLVRKLPGTHRELLFAELDDVPNVVPVIDWGELDDYWVLVMPEAEKSLRHLLLEVNGRLDVSNAAQTLSITARGSPEPARISSSPSMKSVLSPQSLPRLA